MGIEEGQEVQAIGICNVFNKITTENPQISRKTFGPFSYRKLSKSNRFDQNKISPWHIIIKTTSTEKREKRLKDVRQKK
jgi:hypothetical protein